MKTKIFAVVDDNSVTVPALIRDVVEKIGDKIGILKSVTTRPRRGSGEDLFSTMVTASSFIQMKKDGKLAHAAPPYGGSYFGFLKSDVEMVLLHKHGICALTEKMIVEFRATEHQVLIIRVHENEEKDTPQKIQLRADLDVHCSSKDGAIAKGVAELVEFIERSIV